MSILRCPSITEPKLLRLNVTVIGYIFVAYDMDTYASTLLHALHYTVLTALSSSLLRVGQTTTAMRLSDAGRQHRILRPVPDEPKSKTQYMATDASSRLLSSPPLRLRAACSCARLSAAGWTFTPSSYRCEASFVRTSPVHSFSR